LYSYPEETETINFEELTNAGFIQAIFFVGAVVRKSSVWRPLVLFYMEYRRLNHGQKRSYNIESKSDKANIEFEFLNFGKTKI
jgi:exonuclease SbcC